MKFNFTVETKEATVKGHIEVSAQELRENWTLTKEIAEEAPTVFKDFVKKLSGVVLELEDDQVVQEANKHFASFADEVVTAYKEGREKVCK